MSYVLLLVASILVGALIGTVGVGGILLIPVLSACAGLTVHSSMGTALFTFIFTGILGTWLYWRHGSINWGITIPVCAGSLLGGYPGAMANALASPFILNLLLGAVIIFAGIYALTPAKGRNLEYRPGDKKQKLILFLIGACVGFGSGLTGAGGPVLCVPFMVIIGFAPLTSIATSQVIQITAALSGTVGNLAHGVIDMSVAWSVTIAELAGVVMGAHLAHIVSQATLKKVVSIVCVIVGFFIIVRALV